MSTMTAHVRKSWTGCEAALAAGCVLIGVAIAAFGFTDLYLTITHLIHSWWGSWSWTVILLGEGAALGAYLGWLLATLRMTAVPLALSAFLAGYLALFASGSLALMLYAGRASAPDEISHAIVPVSFFGYLLLAKVLVRRLSAAEPGPVDVALADARRYAMDLLRDRKGVLWRWRPSVPSLLRRQVLRCRFKASVVTAVRDSLKEYGEPWEGAVREWVLGAEGLNLKAQAEVASQRAAESIRQEAPAVPAVVTPEPPLAVPPEHTPAAPSRRAPQGSPPGAIRRVQRMGGRKATDEDLAEAVREMYADGSAVTVYRVAKELPIGEQRAKRVFASVQSERAPLSVAK